MFFGNFDKRCIGEQTGFEGIWENLLQDRKIFLPTEQLGFAIPDLRLQMLFNYRLMPQSFAYFYINLLQFLYLASGGTWFCPLHFDRNERHPSHSSMTILHDPFDMRFVQATHSIHE